MSEKNAVCEEIAAERRRQVETEGYTTAHDDEHEKGEIARAAAAFIVPDHAPMLWPWPINSFKPYARRRDLIRAAALVVAEIERLDRRR